jgi:all-trans-nonaprenyl-diphosphate synthase
MGWTPAAPVAADMKKMNENLLNVVGDRHPMLMAAAQQIFGAGGKKLRPMLVFLVAHATAKAGGLTCVSLTSPFLSSAPRSV